MSKLISKQLTQKQRDWLSNSPILPSEFTVSSSRGNATYLILDRDQNGRVAGIGQRMGYKGFVLKVEEADTGAIYAAKICVPDDYETRTEFIETKLANKLRGNEGLFVIPERAGRVSRFEGMPGSESSFVCFISEWIVGETLEQRCQSVDANIDPDFVCIVTREILIAIQFLESRGLKHDDLHWGNVMIRVRDPDLALTEEDKKQLRISIIDMGSLKEFDQATQKSKDDNLSLIQIMTNLHNIIWQRRQIATSYPAFVSGYRKLIEEMAEEDHLRFFPTKESLPRSITQLRENLKNIQLPELNRPFHPFEAISAEHLADDKTLLSLFEDSLPWFSSVLEPKPIVLTGPRGCGKSMLFRYMAAKTHLATSPRSAEKQENLNFFGVYISCATHLQNNLIWIARKPNRAGQLAESITTFFQLVIIREFLRSIAVAYQDESARAHYGLTESGIDRLINYISQYFLEQIETPRLTSKLRILHFADDIDRLRIQLHLDLINERQVNFKLSDTFLGDITTKLRAEIPRFARIPIVFLLDDYSSNRVHPDIQAVLNKVIFERRESHYFKVSCEKFGFIPNDIDGVRIDPTREYEEVDAGSYAIGGLTDTVSKKFLSGLIDLRLELAKWAGRTSTLIGTAKDLREDVKLAKYIREEGSSQGKHSYYYGMDRLASLWSGDIATILQIVKEMFVLGHVDKDSKNIVAQHIQHQAIVSVSRAFKDRICGYHPYGPEMAVILNNFGSMARDILVTGQLDSDGNPRRLYRLEMTKDKPENILTLLAEKNSEAAGLAKELLRRAIFIQLSESRGKEGVSTQTVRWEIRKIFLPAFGTSLERNSYIDIKSLDSFLHMLTDSKSFCTQVSARYLLGKKQDRLTGSLFGESN